MLMSINKTLMAAWLAGAMLAAMLAVATPGGLAESKKPISKKGLLEAIRLNGLSTSELIDRVQERGVNFQMTDDDARELQQAGARPELIEAVRANYRAETGGSNPPRNNGSDYSVPAGAPLSQNEVVTLLQSGVASPRVEKIVEARGVDFSLTPQITSRIKAAGGSSSLIGVIAEKSMSRPEPARPSGRVAPAGPDYDELMDQATSALDAKNWAYGINLLQRGIQMNPAKPTAYSLLEYAELYGNKNVMSASSAARGAIDRGGSAVFRVYHDHDGYFNSYCTGSFFVSKAGVTFKADNGVHTFEAHTQDIKESKPNGFVGIKFNAFHVKVGDGSKSKNYNFAPLTTSKEEANLIVGLMAGYR
jgi:hypothetical protein